MESHRLGRGIFNEEVCCQLALSCKGVVHHCFQGLYEKCSNKKDNKKVFSTCMELLRKQFTDDDFEEEAKCMSSAREEENLRCSFIFFARSVYKDHSLSQNVQVRVSIPPVAVFIKHFLYACSENSMIRSGRFFDADAPPTEQTEACEECIRISFRDLATNYISTAEPEAVETLAPDDSISNVGRREDSSPPPSAPPLPSRRSVATSFDVALTKMMARSEAGEDSKGRGDEPGSEATREEEGGSCVGSRKGGSNAGRGSDVDRGEKGGGSSASRRSRRSEEGEED